MSTGTLGMRLLTSAIAVISSASLTEIVDWKARLLSCDLSWNWTGLGINKLDCV